MSQITTDALHVPIETQPAGEKIRPQLSVSLRMLALFILLASIYFGWVGSIVHRVRHQRNIVAKLESLGAGVYSYDRRRGSLLIEYLVGKDAFEYADCVELPALEPLKDDDVALLAELPEVTSLLLRGPHITDRVMRHVVQLKKLEFLCLDSTNVTADGLQQLSTLDGLQGLSFSKVAVSDEMVDCISELDDLQYLGLSDCSMNRGLRDLHKLRNLETLVLVNVDITQKRGSPFSGLTSLKELAIVDTPMRGECFQHLAGLHNLEFLNLKGQSITDNVLVHLSGLCGLEKLRLNGTQVGDAGLVHLTSLRKLQSLELEGTNVSDASLAPIATMRSLDTLSLNGSNVSANGVAMLNQSDDSSGDCSESKRTVLEELDRLFPSDNIQ